MRRSLKDLTAKELRNRLDYPYFSNYIRARDADENGYVTCCTCSTNRKWNDRMDCGHYSKRNKAHRFNEQNCHAQCKKCNDWGKGEADKHAEFIDKKYGEGTAKELRESENIIINRQREWYLDKIEHYKNKFKYLQQKKELK